MLQQTAELVARQQQAATQAERAHRFAHAQRDALAQANFAHLQALVSLYQALGGGWQEEKSP